MPPLNHEESASGDPRTRWDRASLAFVLLVWLGALLATQVYIATCSTRIPCADDTALFMPRAGQMPFWNWLWALHNEHRLALPKLVQLGLYEVFGDIRSGMYAQAQIYAATALACILAARRLRGSSRPWDAFFPLMWMQLGNAENLLMGFSLCMAIPTACVCAVFFLGVLSPMRLAPSRAIPCALALLALPFCGGNGLLEAPVLGAWLAWLGWSERRNEDPRARLGARILLAGVVLTAMACIAYLIDFSSPAGSQYKFGLRTTARTALGILSLAFGPEPRTWWPLSAWLITGASCAIVFVLARRVRASHARDPVATGTLAVLVAVGCLVLGMALGRPAGVDLALANRYVPLPAPFFVALSLGALAVLSTRTRELVLAGSCVALLANLPSSLDTGMTLARIRGSVGQRIDDLVSTGAPAAEIHGVYTHDAVFGFSSISSWTLQYWSRHALPPFDRGPSYAKADFRFPLFETPPLGFDGGLPPTPRTLDGESVLLVDPRTRISFRFEKDQHLFSGFVGAPDQTVAEGTHPGIRARAYQVWGKAIHELGELTFDPVHVPEQRGMQRFEFHWDAGPAGTLVLKFTPVDASEEGLARGWIKLRGLRLE